MKVGWIDEGNPTTWSMQERRSAPRQAAAGLPFAIFTSDPEREIKKLKLCDRTNGHRPLSALPGSDIKIKLFNFLPGPICFSQKFQTGFDTRITVETANINPSPQLLPSVMIYQVNEYLLQRNAVERIV
jgi:hypothetical protein